MESQDVWSVKLPRRLMEKVERIASELQTRPEALVAWAVERQLSEGRPLPRESKRAGKIE
jgi:metal-responsive CopG/Arc/MetJ family transcriptional regulator